MEVEVAVKFKISHVQFAAIRDAVEELAGVKWVKLNWYATEVATYFVTGGGRLGLEGPYQQGYWVLEFDLDSDAIAWKLKESN